jgi:Domain of unknown function (DUF4266)
MRHCLSNLLVLVMPVVAGLGSRITGGVQIAVLFTVIATAAGCGRNAVRATEKEFLADQIMRFDEDAHEVAADDHVLTNREGSAGGRGAKGGGCGCN